MFSESKSSGNRETHSASANNGDNMKLVILRSHDGLENACAQTWGYGADSRRVEWDLRFGLHRGISRTSQDFLAKLFFSYVKGLCVEARLSTGCGFVFSATQPNVIFNQE